MKPINLPNNVYVSRVLGGILKEPAGRVVAAIVRLEGSLDWWIYCTFFYVARESTGGDVIVQKSPDDLEKTVANVKDGLEYAIACASGKPLRELFVESREAAVVDEKFTSLFANELAS